MIRLLLGVAVLAGATAAFAQAVPQPATAPPPVDRTTQTQDIRFRSDDQNRMTVPVLLSGSGPYQFLVDTAADRSAVSRSIVQK